MPEWRRMPVATILRGVVATFFVIPEWQGSGSSRAMRLADGADHIRAELPVKATTVIAVPPEAGSDEGSGILRLSSLRAVRDATSAALKTAADRPIIIGGDCGIDLAGIQHARASNERLAVIWLDAHADLNTATSSPSGAFHGMVLRTLLGDGPEVLLSGEPIDAATLILAGTRALDNAELVFIEEAPLTMISPENLSADSIRTALQNCGATAVYLHVDLDILDPAEFASIGYPEPFGVSVLTLLEVIAAAKATLPLVGAAVTEFAPATPDAAADDLGTILRIIGALAS